MKWLFLPMIALVLMPARSCETPQSVPSLPEPIEFIESGQICEAFAEPAYHTRRWEKMNRGTYCEAYGNRPISVYDSK